MYIVCSSSSSCCMYLFLNVCLHTYKDRLTNTCVSIYTCTDTFNTYNINLNVFISNYNCTFRTSLC